MSNNSAIKTLSSPCGAEGNTYCMIALWMWKIFPPINLSIGTLGNLLNLVVLFRKRFRKQTTSIYLMCLAVSDTVFLWTALLRNTLLHVHDFDIKVASVFNCKFHEWISSLSGGFSIWLLVLLTIERYIFTKFPLAARQIITQRNTVIAIVIVFSLLALFPIHFVFGNELHSFEINNSKTGSERVIVCRAIPGQYSEFRSGIWINITIMVYTVLPNVFVLTGNTIIAVTLVRLRRRVESMAQSDNSKNNSRAATKLLFLLSSFSLISVTPFIVFRFVFNGIHTSLNAEDFSKAQLAYAICWQSICWNFMYNFILFIFGAPSFRNELKIIFNECKKKVCPGEMNGMEISTQTQPNVETTGLENRELALVLRQSAST